MLKMAATALAFLTAMSFGSAASANIGSDPILYNTPAFDDNFTLTFTGPVNIGRTTVSVYGPHGSVAVGAIKQGAHDTDVVIPVSGDLRPGMYVVHFTAYSSWGTSMTGTSAVDVPGQPSLGDHSGPGFATAAPGQ